MNEKFGFLSAFKVASAKKKTNVYTTPKQGELTDNPPARNYLLTDDETEDEEEHEKAPAVMNRILESSSSSSIFVQHLNENDPDQTYCSVLEKSSSKEVPNVKKSSSKPLFNSEDLVSYHSLVTPSLKTGNSNDDLCSRMSEICVESKDVLKDTVVGPFSDELEEEREAESKKLAETVLHMSSDDDDDDEDLLMPLPPLKGKMQKKLPKVSLPDTIIGFSESMSELSIRDLPPVQHDPEIDEFDEDSEVITVLDSDEEDFDDVDQPPIGTFDESFHNCSSIESSNPKASVESDTTVNRFFNNPPSASSQLVVSHSIIQKHREQPIVEVIKEKSSNVSADRFKLISDELKINESIHDDVELLETDTSDQQEIQEDAEVVATPEIENLQSKVSTQKKRRSSTSSDDHTISISTKININMNMKFSLRAVENSSSSEESSSDSEPSPPKQTPKKDTTRKSDRNSSVRKEKQMGSSTKTTPRTMTEVEDEGKEFQTPEKTAKVSGIDEDLQEILNSLYGEAWKTPQLLRSCKKSKTVRKDLRKSIHANNFDNFVKNLPKDLESTRIGGSSSSDESSAKKKNEIKEKPVEFATPKPPTKVQSKKPTSSVKSTPKSSNKKLQEKAGSEVEKPRYFEICDSDTPSDDDTSSDEDFKPNETWNASSDEDYVDEAERIKKRSLVRKSRRDEEMIFVPPTEDKQKKLDDLLERCEYKKPQGMLGTETPKPSKRKLFTHSHFDEELSFDDMPQDEEIQKEKENVVNLPEVIFPRPMSVSKKNTINNPETPKIKTPKQKSTPKSTTKLLVNKFTVYSFLKSLDVEANPNFCNPEALQFRNNYKSKRIELTDKLFKLYNEKVFDGQLSEVPVAWNKKLLNTAGRCNNSRRGGVRQSQLELSEKVLTSADRLRCTLIHELCHAATWIIQGENGHGQVWKRWAAKANSIFPELPKISVCHDYEIEYRYTYQCVECKSKSHAHSKSKKVENIRCSICRGSIELFLNKKNKNGEIVQTPVSKEVKGFPKYVQMNYKDVKKPQLSHKEVMQVLSQQFGLLTVEEKKNL